MLTCRWSSFAAALQGKQQALPSVTTIQENSNLRYIMLTLNYELDQDWPDMKVGTRPHKLLLTWKEKLSELRRRTMTVLYSPLRASGSRDSNLIWSTLLVPWQDQSLSSTTRIDTNTKISLSQWRPTSSPGFYHWHITLPCKAIGVLEKSFKKDQRFFNPGSNHVKTLMKTPHFLHFY